MTASQISKTLHGRRFGSGYMCRCPCPVHSRGDRNRSLSVREIDGWVRLKCFTGCSREEILGAMGLSIRDLALNEFKRNPEWEQHKSDRERLEILERRHGLFIMLQTVEPGKRNYYAAAERNTAVEIKDLRRKLYPVEAYYERRNERVQRIITEYGFEELWNCLPMQRLLQQMESEREL